MRFPVASPVLGEAEKQAIVSALESGWISSQGSFIERFEKGFAQLCHSDHGVSAMNGTAALHLALAAVGVGPGDEVIVPDLTFAATAEAVRHAGARPILVDVDARNWGMDPEKVEAAITERTRAIIPVHLYGHPCDIDPVLKLARKNGFFVIEDAAEAHGATYKSKPVGSLGDIGVFSFYGNKIITTGEGGICVTDDNDLANRMRLLRSHGQSRRYWHDQLGWNYRMTNLQAAIGVAQLARFEDIVADRRRIGRTYRDCFRGTAVVPAPEAEWADTVYWLYSILVPGARDAIALELATRGIETRPFFYPLHEMPPFRETRQTYPVASHLSQVGLNLPSLYEMKHDEIEWIATEVIDVTERLFVKNPTAARLGSGEEATSE